MKIKFYLCPRTSIQKACFDSPFSLIIKLIRKTRQMLAARKKLQRKMLELTGIHKSFGDVRVLNGVDLRLESGFVYTLKGGNGSGKTTLINIISGFLTPSKGEVRFKGKKIAKFAPYRVNRLGIGRTMLLNPALIRHLFARGKGKPF